MSEQPLVRDLFEIPEHVRTSDFVSVLTRDVSAPERTAETYVPTPALVDTFDRALDLVGHALSKHETRGAVLHGSFGSGKSHFMAMLSLMIQGHEAPWRLPELHPIRGKHAWLDEMGAAGGKRVLELHVHMLGKESMEQAIFDAYVDHVQKNHAGASLPALYADKALFDNAQSLRETLGDEPFFAKINEAVGAGGSGLKKRKRWSAERFDAAVGSSEPAERRKLFDALVKSHFSAFVTAGGSYLPFSEGLQSLTSHARDLGYSGLVLFLDELILWLATEKVRSINEETPKIGQLGELDGAIPIVSFIAQQRGLDEMVGDQVRGEEQARLKQLLHFWEDRFDHLQFENKNLPAVIEKRLLSPQDDAAKEALQKAFATMQKRTGRAYATLVAGEDTDAFRKLYPFSPALVETLVALSTALSRHRTAIKLLAEILVDHIPDLRLGQLVLLGDVFDVLHDDMADGMVRHRLRDAKKLYHQVLPVIQDKHGTKTPERCQRLRDDAERRRSLGCSGCPERGCRSDNRLLKTLLVAALVPTAESLKNLTVTRLAELNQGGLHVALQGNEARVALATLQSWELSFPEVRIGEGKDPRVWVELGGIDVEPILQQAHAVDNIGQQKQMLQQLLLESLGVESGGVPVTFHNVKRPGKVRFGNVRTMGDEQLYCEEGDEWQLLVDYPFDEAGHGPAEDEAKVEKFLESGKRAWTLVWLPSFLSEENERHLRDLVKLNEILRTSDSKQRYLGGFGHEKRAEAKRVLEQLRMTKKRRLMSALEVAYGVKKGNDADLDETRSVDRHLWLLQPVAFTPRSASSLRDAYEKHVHGILSARYPSHPHLELSVNKSRADELAQVFDDAAASPDKQNRLTEKRLLDTARGVLEPLGVARVIDDTVHVHAEARLRSIEQTRQQKNVEDPTVGDIVAWADPDETRGLRTPSAETVAALFVRTYASWQGRTFERAGERYDPEGKRALPADAVLRQPEMPTPREWDRARELASASLGVKKGLKMGHRPDNVAWFAGEVRKELDHRDRREMRTRLEACAELPGLLAQRLATFGVDSSERLVTARSADALTAGLEGLPDVDLVRFIAGFEPKTSATAVGASFLKAPELVQTLGDDLLFGYFEPLDPAKHPGAPEVLEPLRKVLRQDENQAPLSERLVRLARVAQDILRPATGGDQPQPLPPTPRPGRTELLHEQVRARGSEEIEAVLDSLLAKVREAPGSDLELTVDLRLTGKTEEG